MSSTRSASSAWPRYKGLISRLLVAYVAVFVPGLLSIYNPHQYPTDPLFQPDALKPLPIAALLAVSIMAFVSRNWRARTVKCVFVVGLLLTLATIVALVVASMMAARLAPIPIAVALYAGTLAIPCVATLYRLLDKENEGKP